MWETLALAVLACTALYALKMYRQLSKNIADAKVSGIPYQVVPFFLVNRLWQISSIFVLPILRRLPLSWTDPWLDITLEWGYTLRYQPFKRMGSDTFLTVSPGRIVLNTADASVINQITNRRNDFPKALEVYESLKIYGSNVVVTEGQEWRHHRKITSPPFTEKNNLLVWMETLDQSQAMIKSWFGADKQRSKVIRTIADDAMRLSLHIISRAGFGVSLSWPTEETRADGKEGAAKSSSNIPQGHMMSYTDALGTVLHSIILILTLPWSLLKNLPFHATKRAYTSYIDWGQYMREMLEEKKAQVFAGTESDKLDLMIAMLKGAGVTAKSKDGKAPEQALTDEEILGNAFVFILAGHETTANSIHFCLIYLAMNPSCQKHLQRDLDEIFQGRPVNQWDYDKDVPKLFGSMAGAVLNEELRLIPPVVGIPKSTTPRNPQPLTVNGKKCTVPENTYIALMCPSAHRNPNQWPTGPPADPNNPTHPYSNLDNDLEEFKPERWLLDPTTTIPEPTNPSEPPDLAVSTAPDTSPALYKPPKGAYIPFSEGHRSCLGRRFAQIELLAFLAILFSQYSVELAVDEWASDEKVEGMGEVGRREVWGKAKKKVERMLVEDMGSVITLQLRRGVVGLRFVRRGSGGKGGMWFDWE